MLCHQFGHTHLCLLFVFTFLIFSKIEKNQFQMQIFQQLSVMSQNGMCHGKALCNAVMSYHWTCSAPAHLGAV